MELFRLLGTIAINGDDAKKAIDDVTDEASKSESKMSNAFEKIGGAAVKVGAVMAKGVAVGASALATLSGLAIKGYADYEQLVGGVDTLFKESSQKVQQYADMAYKTAGMSANEYMETVTGFSASLLQSLGGDTEAAADKANQAIIDMADNANKMGSSLESIQNAYSGFAKQNYTMLDNLKLGYGGTKEEMERLLADAEKFSGIKYDISNYADVVDAIHVIQDEMGIAGTTAKEASETISGSASAMKAAWQNLLVGIADENADVSGLIDNLFTSAGNFAGNIIPRIEATLQGIGSAVKKGLPKILNMVMPLVEKMLPGLLSTTLQMLGMLASAVIEKLPELVDFIFETLGSLFEENSVIGGIIDSISSIWDAITNLGGAVSTTGDVSGAFSTMASGISTAWNSIGQPVFDAITSGINWLAENWGSVSSGISAAFSGLWTLCQSAWANIGQPIWDLIMFAVSKVQQLFSENMPAIMGFFKNAVNGIKDTWNNHLKPALDAIGYFLEFTLKPAFEYVFDAIIKPLVENVFNYIKSLWEDTLKPVFDGICDFLAGVFTLDFEKALTGIGEIVAGIFGGILDTVESVIGTVVDILSGAIEKIKEFLGFAEEAEGVELHESVSGTSHGGGGGKRGGVSTSSTSGTEYYADGAVLTKATAFGLNPFNGKTMVGGEAGAEAIAPISTLQSYIADAVGAKDEAFLLAIERIIDNQTNAMVSAILALQESGIIKLDDPYKLFKLVKEQQRRYDLKTT